MRVVIVGGGIAGLGAALLLTRAGNAVRVLERDAMARPPSPVEAFEKWRRPGAPQVRHSHAFLARLRNLLRERMPDLLEALHEAGAEDLPLASLLPPELDDRTPRPGDEELTMLGCRRLTFEWVLRRQVEREPGLELVQGAQVTGLVRGERDEEGCPRVAGVLARREGAAQELFPADLVVDAAGRRSDLGRWLGAIGAARPAEETQPCGIFYVSRFYRLRPGRTPPQQETALGADLGHLKYGIFHGDGGIFSVTFAASPEDPPLRALLRPAPFAAAAAAVPATAAWVDPSRSEAITDVHGMASLRSTRRRLVREGDPVASGVVAIGDAAVHTNPLYGRGCTFALLHACLLADAVTARPEAPLAQALALEEATRREIVPWYEMARRQDREAIRVARARREGRPDPAPLDGQGRVDPRAYMRDLVRHGLVPAVRRDAHVLRAFLRSLNLLDAPQDLMKRPEILQRVLACYRQRGEREETTRGPDRSTLVSLLERAS